MLDRPSWPQYFMEMAYLVSKRSTCLRRKVGAILVINNQIISTGYNGSPKRVNHCEVAGCLRAKMQVPSGERHELCRGVHAEQNAIIQAATNGTSTKNAVLYCTNHPCVICAKMIINAEIQSVYIAENYPDPLAEEMLKEAGVNLYLVDTESGEIRDLTA